MTDYDRLIDAETWAFIRATEAWYPPETANFTVEEQRAVYNRMCAAFRQPRPAGLEVVDEAHGGVPCRRYEPSMPAATVLYLHGGGFVVGGLDSHDDVCAEIAARGGVRVVSADYRLSPEHRHPAAFHDALAAAQALALTFPGPLLLVGDSAGGNLAAAVAHASRKAGPEIAGQILIYPALGADRDRGSYLSHAHAPMLTLDDVLFYACIRHEGEEPVWDPTANPLQDSDVSNLPPTVLFAAECDPLHDDAVRYAERLRAAGVPTSCVTGSGLVHGYLRARSTVTRARESFDRIVAAVTVLARGDAP